jgi:hypothetical protein
MPTQRNGRGASSPKAASPSKPRPSPKNSKSREKKTSASVKKNVVAKNSRKKNPACDIVGLFKTKIPVYEPGEERYERSNATAKSPLPFLETWFVMQPENAAHVKYITKQAKHKIYQNIPIMTNNRGQSYSGSSTANKGTSPEARKMNQAQLDMESMTLSAQGGALWGNIYKQLVNRERSPLWE